jgi:hypothetical protein
MEHTGKEIASTIVEAYPDSDLLNINPLRNMGLKVFHLLIMKKILMENYIQNNIVYTYLKVMLELLKLVMLLLLI